MEIVLFVLKMMGIGAAKKAGEKIAEPIIEKIQPLFNAVRNKFKQKQIEGVLNNLEQDFSLVLFTIRRRNKPITTRYFRRHTTKPTI